MTTIETIETINIPINLLLDFQKAYKALEPYINTVTGQEDPKEEPKKTKDSMLPTTFLQKLKKKEPKPAKVYSYKNSLKPLFSKKGIEYDCDKSLEENMDRICEETQTNYKIVNTKRTKEFYKCQTTYPTLSTLRIESENQEAKEDMVSKISQKQNSIPEPDKIATPDIKAICGAFGLTKKKDNNVYPLFKNEKAIVKQLIFDTFKNTGIENLTEVEAIIADECQGPVCYLKGKKNLFIKEGYSYDINSHHPYILQLLEFRFPIRAGKNTFIAKPEDIDVNKIAIYAIMFDTNIEYFQPADGTNTIWQSNYMVKLLIDNNIEFKMLKLDSNGEPFNCIMYDDTDCVTGKSLFGETIRKLYKLSKKDGNKTAKSMLHTFFGDMTTKQIVNSKIYEADECPIVPPGYQKNELGYGRTEIYEKKTTTPIARLKIFFYDFCRYEMYTNTIKPLVDEGVTILRIKSDSILIDQEMDEDSLSNTIIGQFKKEMLLKNVTYPHVNHSFKAKPVDGALLWNKDTDKYEPIIKPIIDDEEEEEEETN